MAKILSFSRFFSLSIICAFNSISHCSENKPYIEWKSDNWGLFSNLMRAVEWIYCVKHSNNFALYLNMTGSYGFDGNTFSVIFKPFEDPKISTTPRKGVRLCRTVDFPRVVKYFKKYPTDGMKNYDISKYVYMGPGIYTDPDFSIFRNRLHPIILQYFKPAPELQKKIDTIMQEMNLPAAELDHSPQPNLKIGIHVRGAVHYQHYTNAADQFLDDVERDIDQMMESKDPSTTKIFLATLVDQLVERLSAKYNVVVCDIPRSTDVWLDWCYIPNADPMDMARDALVDTWCLAHCDELWGAASNMVIFAGCLNPNLKIRMIPCLKEYAGW